MLVLLALAGDDHRASQDGHKAHTQIQGNARVAGIAGLHVLAGGLAGLLAAAVAAGPPPTSV